MTNAHVARSTLLAAMALGVSGCAHGPVAAGVPWSETPGDPQAARVYSGEGGIEVSIVPLQIASGDKALVRVTGARSEIDGLVLLCERFEFKPRTYSWLTPIAGTRIAVMLQPENQLVLPEHPGVHLPLKLEEGRSVDAKALSRLHILQATGGTLARVQAFDRARLLAFAARELVDNSYPAKVCGEAPPIELDASTFDDAALKDSAFGLCPLAMDAFGEICGASPPNPSVFRSAVKKVVCRLGPKTGLELDAAGTVTWTVPRKLDGNTGAFYAKDVLLASAPGGGKTLGERLAEADRVLCDDGKGRLVLVATKTSGEQGRLYYGDAKRLHAAQNATPFDRPHREERVWFFDPRIPSGNGGWLVVDSAKGACQVECGKRKADLKLVPAAKVSELLASASLEGPLHTRTPHALARDSHGTYYFVDKGSTPETEKGFRLFVGPKGKLKLQQMKDVVVDSEGQVFASATGKLRLVLGKQTATWIEAKRTQPLQWVPVEENLPMIYGELGVYVGERLGTPCDDF